MERAGLNAEQAGHLARRWLRDHAATPRRLVGEPLEAASAWAFRVEVDPEFDTSFGLLVVDKFDAYMEQWRPDEDGGWPDAYEQARPLRVESQRELEMGARRMRGRWWLVSTAALALLVAGLIALVAAERLALVAAAVFIPLLCLLWGYCLTLLPRAIARMRHRERAHLLEAGDRRGWPT